MHRTDNLLLLFSKNHRKMLQNWEKKLLKSLNCCSDGVELSADDGYCLNDLAREDGTAKLLETVQQNFEFHQDGGFQLKRPQSSNCRVALSLGLLKLFIRTNYIGEPIERNDRSEDIHRQLKSFGTGDSAFLVDGEGVDPNFKYAGCIPLAKLLLDDVQETELRSLVWWQFRINFLHQKVLEEKSVVLYQKMKDSIDAIRLVTNGDPELVAMFATEVVEMYLYYYDVSSAKTCLVDGMTAAGIEVSLSGALGRRTKYQQMDLPQLRVEIQKLNGSFEPMENPVETSLPSSVPLQDDTRLEHIKFTENHEIPELSEVQQLIVLNDLLIRKRTLPKDDVAESELKAFIQVLLKHPKNWFIHYVALFYRSLVEQNHRRTVERSLQQLEELKRQNPSTEESLTLYFGSHCPPKFKLDMALADVYVSLGSINSALDLYLKLKAWYEAIDCYHVLQLRHKAEELVRQELEKEESVKLWCLLGDATDNSEYYEKAWEMSKHKSAKVQRQWGFLYFKQKKFALAAEHLAKSVELNPLEYPVWMRLAFSAMESENWELCASAYRHACNLDSDNFESWNNLSNAYLKLGDKPRAMRVLIEATKCDYNVWQVWDNLLIVATDCKAFNEAIKAYNRLLDMKEGKHADAEVLGVITRHVCENLPDFNGDSSLKYIKPMLKLLGRLTATVTTNGAVWKFYSDLLVTSETMEPESQRLNVMHRSVDCAQKAVRCVTQDPNWTKTTESCKKVIEFASNLCLRTSEYLTKYREAAAAANFKTVALFTIRKVIASIERDVLPESRTKLGYTELVEQLKQDLQN